MGQNGLDNATGRSYVNANWVLWTRRTYHGADGRLMTEQKKQINVELRDEEAEGVYANFAAITHSPAEFVMDFIRVLPGTKKSRVHARIVMAPQNVKAFVRALQDNIAKYEERHGEIKSSGQTQPGKQIGFQ